MDLINIVKDTFYSLISEFQMDVLKDKRGTILIKNEYCLINVDTHFGENYVSLKENSKDILINPLLWAYVHDKLNYKDIIPLKYPKNMQLEDIVRYNLFLEAQYIRLYCKDILIGNTDKINYYYQNYEKLLIKLNEYFEKSYKR